MELILTHYCKRQGVRYKQGLNEVLAPFVNFHQYGVDQSHIFDLFSKFVEKFLPNAFVDDEFTSLQCWFTMFNLLLKYHDPQLHQFLNANELPPECYATPWFLTLFAR